MRTGKRLLLAIAACVAAALALCATASAQAPAQDSAVGSGSAGSFFTHFEFSATSNAVGGSPSGTASWEQFGYHFEGTVSCLSVTDNRAVIGIDVDTAASGLNFQGFFLTVRDRGPAGSGLDSFDAVPTLLTSAGDTVPTDCAATTSWSWEELVTTGDITVRDAPNLPTSAGQCKNGGWRIYGVFSGEGDCVSFVATGGKNPPDKAAPPTLLDQSFTAPSQGGAIINECCNFIAQTFTAGRDGLLVGLNIETWDATPSEPDPPLQVSIRNTENGLPGQTVLATTVLDSTVAPITQLISFAEPVPVRAGTQYAIVVNLVDPSPDARAGWVGAINDWYPAGALCLSFDDGVTWSCDNTPQGFDLHFRTYVARITPSTKDPCRNDGWRSLGFASQGECVSFVNRR